MKQRFFQLDTEWNVIHYPEKPNGFGVLVIGGAGHFVEEKNSFWLQHVGRNIWLQDLKEAGYTVFCSNLYGNHWGSEEAISLVDSLYHYVLRHEILNQKIHIFAEGMGALIIPSLVQILQGKIRSINIVDPYLSIQEKMDEEKHHLFFYKKFMNELENSNPDYKNQIHFNSSADQWLFKEPLSIFYVMEGNRLSLKNESIEKIVKKRKQILAPTQIRYILPERRTHISKLVIRNLMENEEL
ncbi:hypothetical protein GCM10008967_01480 [Bacillus carboniphilus]|uniref:Alpha/beta hydrolase n=1 Tax=Bacillus carboniphilus TaxID=86663 RepID=A0ABN0VQG1_9BACI